MSATIAKQITEDWQREIPSLGIYAPRRLLRRTGPLLVGICLERDSGGTTYKPMFHVHCLGSVTNVVGLTLFTQLRSERSGGPDYVEVCFHDRKYKDAAARMIRQSLLPLKGDLSLDKVITAYREYLASPLGRAYPVALFRDMILLSAWGNRRTEALELLADCLRIGDDLAFQSVGGRAQFETECRALIEQPLLIGDTVDTQVVALGVGARPVSQLLQ